MDNELDNEIQGSEDTTPKKTFFQKILEELAEKKKAEIREKIGKEIDGIETSELTESEMSTMFTQFGTYTSLQLLRIVAVKLYGKKANALINEIIEAFIAQGRQTLMVKQQIDSIEQTDSELSNLLGADLMDKERELVTKRVDRMYDKFRKEIREVLLIDPVSLNKLTDEDTDDNTESPW
jgi:tRNA C32,U32 (ribose-2'-O)-methylase TrmJ